MLTGFITASIIASVFVFCAVFVNRPEPAMSDDDLAAMERIQSKG